MEEKIAASQFIRCIGAYSRSQLQMWSQRKYWGKIHIVPLGVDPKAFSPRISSKEKDAIELLCVGRLVRAKGQSILIEAVDDLIRKGKKVHLTLLLLFLY